MDEPAAGPPAAPARALVLVDVQRGLVEGDRAVPGAGPLLQRLGLLLDRARRAQALVVHLQNDGPPGAVDEPCSPGWALCLARPQEAVLRKTDDDGFAGTRLGALLEDRGVRRLVIGGLLSEMCVSATARTALARGLSVVLPHDAHATYDLEDVPASVVSRVAEHALGDRVELVRASADVAFAPV